MEILVLDLNTRWKSHPVVGMWRGYEAQLFFYAAAIHQEMLDRGYKPSANWERLVQVSQDLEGFNEFVAPVWFKYEDRITLTHRARLYQKRPDLYPQFKEDNDKYIDKFESVVCCPRRRNGHGPCTYFWPTHVDNSAGV